MSELQTTLGDLMTRFDMVILSRRSGHHELEAWKDGVKLVDAAALRLDVLLGLLEAYATEPKP